ncbi:Retinoblastoma-binding protein 5 [Coccomyxa sp. Obi]|nr:Retinoblastoma-binding protein 5 [Coccomyxa sp. Obi]
MNRRLLDPFQSVQLPEAVEEVLGRGTARCVAFNAWGTLLAAGTETGEVVVWDFETRVVARTFQAHNQAVTCLAWARSGRYLMSGSLDRTVSLWDILENKQAAKMQCVGPAVALSVDRKDPFHALVSYTQGAAELVNFHRGTSKPLPTIPLEAEGKKAKGSSAPVHAVAVLSRDGSRIFLGQARGILAVLDTQTLQFLDAFKLTGAPRVTHLSLSRKGDRLLANCSDRVARLFEIAAPSTTHPQPFSVDAAGSRIRVQKAAKADGNGVAEAGVLLRLTREFQNAHVERSPWRAVVFNQDMEYVAAATEDHRIYFWSLLGATLEKILEFEGSKDDFLDMAWNPARSSFVSVGTSGKIYVWSRIYKENWSAFAPDFEELDENQEYIEREDEFDINPRPAEENGHAGTAGSDDDLDVDVETVEPDLDADWSSDEGPAGEPPLKHLPICIERRVSPPPAQPPEETRDEGADDMDTDGVSLSASDREGDDGAAASAEQQSEALGRGRRNLARSRSRGESDDEADLGRQQSAGRMRPPNNALPSGLDDLEIPGDLF